MSQQRLRLIQGTADLQTLLPKQCLSMCEWISRSSPARRDSAASSSFTAPGRIGAPPGSRNRFTSTKSQPRAGWHASRSNQ